MADGYVQIQPESTGKKIDVAELTRADATIVERQRVEIPGTVQVDSDSLDLILVELRVLTLLLTQAFGLGDNIEALRSEINLTL